MTEDLSRLCSSDQIRLLLAIASTRSFSAAAAQIGVSQPSVSQQVKRIEHAVGRPIFTRRRSGVALTAEGEAVVAYAKAIQGLTRDLKHHLESTSGAPKISIGMSEDFVRTVLPGVLWIFMRDYPHVDLQIISGSYEILARAIEDKSIDLVIMRRYALLPNAQLLWSEPSIWVGSADLPKPLPDPVPLVVPFAPNPARDLTTSALSAAGRSWRIRFQSPSLASNEAAMQARLGICAAAKSMRLYGVGPLDADAYGLPALPAAEFVIAHTDDHARPLVAAFSDLLLKVAETNYAPKQVDASEHHQQS